MINETIVLTNNCIKTNGMKVRSGVNGKTKTKMTTTERRLEAEANAILRRAA
jgi:hypothetical protein